MANIHSEKILILDFGSQVTQLIARRVREIGVYCEIYPFDADVERLRRKVLFSLVALNRPQKRARHGLHSGCLTLVCQS